MSRKVCPACGMPLDMAHVPEDLRDLLREHRRPDPLWYVGPLECPVERQVAAAREETI